MSAGRRPGTALLVALLAAGGCMPHVLHGPRVEPGTTGMVSLTAGRNADLTDGELQFLPSLYAGVRHGWVSGETGFSLGVQVPPLMGLFALDAEESDDVEILLATSYLDAYLEPRRAGIAGGQAGVGVLASTDLFMPYLQYGRANEQGQGWYTTQGLLLPNGDWGGGAWWLPTLAWREVGRSGRNAVNLSLTGGVGTGDVEFDSSWFVILGFTVEFGLDESP